jgi:UDP-glucose 4-epimerase
MKILVTGSGGFIGSQVLSRLAEEGHTLVPFDITSGNDILDRDEVDSAVGAGIDVVYHIAAQADLTKIASVDDAYQTTELNVTGTHNVAYACAKYGVWMVYASTVCVYGNQEQHPETEDATLPNPSELYAYTKWAGEQVVRGYGINFGMPYTILRFATIYGPGMREALATHIFFNQAYAGEDITVHGTGTQDRTQTYVGDLVDGIVAVHRHPEAQGHIINLTATESISVNRMAEDIKRITNSPSRIVHTADRANQTFREDFSTEKAKNLLGWTPEHSWEEGLEKTAAWLEAEKGYAKHR